MMGKRILLIGIVGGLVALIAGLQAVPGGAAAQPAPTPTPQAAPAGPAAGVKIVVYYWVPVQPNQPPPSFAKEGITEMAADTFSVMAKSTPPPTTQDANQEAQLVDMLKQVSGANAQISSHLQQNYLGKGWKINSVQGVLLQQVVTFYLVPEK